jgi:protein TonB
MSTTNRERQQPDAPLSLLLFSAPPREAPSFWKTVGVVTAAHVVVLTVLFVAAWLSARAVLPDGLTQTLEPADNEVIGLPVAFDAPPAVPPARRPARAAAAKAPRNSAPRIARVDGPRQASLLGVPVMRVPDPPSVVPSRIPERGTHEVIPETFARLPARTEVQPVAPRGVNGNGSSDGGGNGDNVENMSLDELAREPRFTPFTQAPELLNRAEIKAFLQRRYPAYMSMRGQGGRCVLWLLIDPAGGIRKGLLLRSSGNATLDDAALEAIDRMEFRPAINKGRPVPVWVQLPVSFQPNW